MQLELTKRADYALRAVLALARVTHAEPQSVRRIAAEQRVPVAFLPQVMRDLVRAGIVEGTIGRNGGYRLAKPAIEITLLDVIEAVEGNRHARVCILRGGPCAVDGVCDVHAVFAAAQNDVIHRLHATNVAAAVASG